MGKNPERDVVFIRVSPVRILLVPVHMINGTSRPFENIADLRPEYQKYHGCLRL